MIRKPSILHSPVEKNVTVSIKFKIEKIFIQEKIWQLLQFYYFSKTLETRVERIQKKKVFLKNTIVEFEKTW